MCRLTLVTVIPVPMVKRTWCQTLGVHSLASLSASSTNIVTIYVFLKNVQRTSHSLNVTASKYYVKNTNSSNALLTHNLLNSNILINRKELCPRDPEFKNIF